jgi:CDP-glucose 4,6-dehydratase
LGEALSRIVEWHKGVAQGGDAQAISLAQLSDYRAAFTRR